MRRRSAVDCHDDAVFALLMLDHCGTPKGRAQLFVIDKVDLNLEFKIIQYKIPTVQYSNSFLPSTANKSEGQVNF